MKRILLTGGTGLIGTHLLRQFASRDQVFAVSRSGDVEGATRSINVDLGKPWSWSAFPDDIDTIIHLAQSEHYRDFPYRAENVFAVNTFSTIKLLDYAREVGVKNFILASSGGVYGTGATRFSEDAALLAQGDLGFYIGSRLCSEILSEPYAAFMNIITLRFFFVYGAGQRENMLLPRLVRSVYSGSPISLHGPDGLSINPVHVSDATRAIIAALDLEGSHKFNIAGPNVVTLRRISETIGDVLGKKPVYSVFPEVKPQDLIADIEKMSALLHEPKVSLIDGIKDLVVGLPRE